MQPRTFCDGPQPTGGICNADSDCALPNAICADLPDDGQCEADCLIDEDCGEGGICSSDEGGEGGTCYMACTDDTDCRSDRACIGGADGTTPERSFCDPP